MYFEDTSINGVPYEVPLVVLRTRACRWFAAGGCIMCNYELYQARGSEVTDNDLFAQVRFAIARLGPLDRYAYIFVGSGGSLLDPLEIPDAIRSEILETLRRAGLRRISFESEAKFCLNVDRLRSVSAIFPLAASVGIGVESSDEFVRNVVLNKGLPTEILTRATATLRSVGIPFYTYVLLGKPFLTARDDEDDAIQTIMDTSSLGAFMSVLEVTNVQPYTLTEWLWRREEYVLPSLWSAVRILRELPSALRPTVSVKGFDCDAGVPKPLGTAGTCKDCSDRVRGALRAWNRTRDESTLVSLGTPCHCYTRAGSSGHRARDEIVRSVTATAQRIEDDSVALTRMGVS
jgi:radical SAM enzyme (TIGR01210 family)